MSALLAFLTFLAGFALGGFIFFHIGIDRASNRVNREWIDQPEWKAIRLTSWGAWLHRLAKEKRK